MLERTGEWAHNTSGKISTHPRRRQRHKTSNTVLTNRLCLLGPQSEHQDSDSDGCNNHATVLGYYSSSYRETRGDCPHCNRQTRRSKDQVWHHGQSASFTSGILRRSICLLQIPLEITVTGLLALTSHCACIAPCKEILSQKQKVTQITTSQEYVTSFGGHAEAIFGKPGKIHCMQQESGAAQESMRPINP